MLPNLLVAEMNQTDRMKSSILTTKTSQKENLSVLQYKFCLFLSSQNFLSFSNKQDTQESTFFSSKFMKHVINVGSMMG